MALKLTEIADRINTHLRRFERDTEINCYPPNHHTHTHGDGSMRPYWGAGARRAGNRANVSYIRYQGATTLTRAEAEAYLAWLDDRNVGRHWEQQREASE